MKTTIVKLDAKRPNLGRLRDVAAQLLQGKIIAFPTETVYGLAVAANQPQAIARLKKLKARPEEKSFAYHIGSLAALERLDIIQSRVFRFFANQFWPGPISLLALNRRDEKVGLRFPNHPIATEMLRSCDELVVATSANKSGEGSATRADDVLKSFPDGIDVLIDGGRCPLGEDSTLVDTVTSPPSIVRKGAFSENAEHAIQRVEEGRYPRKYIWIACTGNTCRSPLAEAWLQRELSRKKLGEQIVVRSCGFSARDGFPASMESILILKNAEINFEQFRSQKCRSEELVNADLVITMTDDHRRAMVQMCPDLKGRIQVLDIKDPIGMTHQFYEEVFQEIQKKIQKIWSEVIK